MREPRVETGKRTMVYMAHLARLHRVRAAALLPAVAGRAGAGQDDERRAGRAAGRRPARSARSSWSLTLFSEATLLVVAAQAGFIDGPRVLANMAVDSWVPHRFAALSERLTTQNGILLMGGGGAGRAALHPAATSGHLVVMYTINVFLTFSLSMVAMLRFWARQRRRRGASGGAGSCCSPPRSRSASRSWPSRWWRSSPQGGWVTVLVTASSSALCFRDPARTTARRPPRPTRCTGSWATWPQVTAARRRGAPALDPTLPTAAMLVGSYGGWASTPC